MSTASEPVGEMPPLEPAIQAILDQARARQHRDFCYQCDTDGDGIADSCSVFCDSDGDGINDSCYQCDTNGDGIADACYACDTNGDGVKDSCYTDDTNGDGINDACSFHCDTNGDGIPDAPWQCDTDGDGINDACYACDTDGDGKADACYICDNDGTGRANACYGCDTDGDGKPDACYGCDTDGDGTNDACSVFCDSDGDGVNDSCYQCDTDGDGIADVCYQCDTDGDGINDSCYACDTNGDGKADACYTCDTNGTSTKDSCYTDDTNGDGIKDACLTHCDTDGDGIPDVPWQCDTDGDGANDACYACDTDGDGTNDTCYQCDTDGDGKTDACFACDTDGDGMADTCYACDSDGDGKTDACYACDTDGDGMADACYVCDNNGDGLNDSCYQCDTDGDGMADACYQCDTNGDGTKDACYQCDTNGDGAKDSCYTDDTNGDGIKDACLNHCDTDGDGIADAPWQCDTNGDGINDTCYACDTDGDGKSDACYQCDANGDGTKDACYECDTDGDGKSDACYQCDTDGDGKADACYQCDTNGDGKADSCYTDDTNGDGIKDACSFHCCSCANSDLAIAAGEIADAPWPCDTDGDNINDSCYQCDYDEDGINESCLAYDTDGDGKKDACYKVELQIYNGLEGYSGGQLADKEKGAVTVANLNDTNGDGIADNKQDTVKKVGPQGRDEIDLMKLVLKKPVPDKGGNVKLTVKGGKVKIWEKNTKETPVALTEDDNGPYVEFATTALDKDTGKTLWVEAIAPSAKLRDIVLELEYKGEKDTVKATALWVEFKRAFVDRRDKSGKIITTVPENLDRVLLRNAITKDLDADINGRKALDGSYYGIGSFSAKTPRGGGVKADTRIGGRILLEFEIKPHGVEDLGVVFDITRQKKYRDSLSLVGLGILAPQGTADFPEPKKDNETPNDDGSPSDEDNKPTNHMIYSWDEPSNVITATFNMADEAFTISRNHFREWVRVQISKPFANKNGVVEGSRASDMQSWHVLYYLVRDANGKYGLDDINPSNSAPLRTGTGNGAATVTLLKNADTEGFVATYDLANKKWTLTAAGGGTVSDAKAGAIPQGTMWNLTIANKVKVVITQGATAFANGDKFAFSVFKSTADGGKKNEIDLGPINVTTGP